MHFPIVRHPLAVIPAALCFHAIPAMALAQSESGRFYHGPGMMWGGGSGGFGMMFGFVFMLILIAAVVIGTILLLRHFGIGGNDLQTDAAAGRMRAMDILEERYAKGEIDSKEFEERKAKLSG